MRFDPVFTEIRMAREEDDPSLPMGVWERPLKRADWALIEVRCKTVLTQQSKDLQIAAWLAEAWTRQHGEDQAERNDQAQKARALRFAVFDGVMGGHGAFLAAGGPAEKNAFRAVRGPGAPRAAPS